MENNSVIIDTPLEKMRTLLKNQQSSFLQEGAVEETTRIDRLDRLYHMIGKNQQAILLACNADFGNRSLHMSQMAEILSIMGAVDYSLRYLKKWMKNDHRKVVPPLNLMGAKARIEYQPKGVIGVIGTWNFPVYTSLLPAVGAIAAGNRVMVKLSELTPNTSNLIAKLIGDYFDESEIAAVTGGAEVGAAFAKLPLDHIIFTGGTNIGKHILKAAAENLTPVTLELGGKSPVIIGRSYDIKKAAERIMTGKAFNHGQACLAPDYCFVPTESKEEFIVAATEHFSKLFPTIIDNPDYTSVINKQHHNRITSMIDDAREKGADIREINPSNEDFTTQKEGLHKIPMTLVVDPTDEMHIMQDEIFGPAMCIKTYDSLDDCIHYINHRPRPLGLYYFGEDSAEERLVLDKTISGGVTINDVMAHSGCEDLPFGGIGDSGMGHYHGFDGFKTFSHAKAIYKQSKLDIMSLVGMLPPYTEKTKKTLDKQTQVKR